VWIRGKATIVMSVVPKSGGNNFSSRIGISDTSSSTSYFSWHKELAMAFILSYLRIKGYLHRPVAHEKVES